MTLRYARLVLVVVLGLLATLAVACGAIDLGSHGRDAGLDDGGTPPEGGGVTDATTDADVLVDADAASDAHPTYVKASNTRADARFGVVALDGDTLAVGAIGDASGASGVDADQTDTSAPRAGAVHIFRRTSGAWKQEAYLKASAATAGALFGISVAVSGDTIAVGASGEANATGAVYVFQRTPAGWVQQARLVASNARAGAELGASVALGPDTLVVGSSGESSATTGVNGDASDTSAPGAGAAYVFTRNGVVWTESAYLKASNARAAAAFGSSVAVDKDTIAVGSLKESSSARGVSGNQSDTSVPGAGAVYVFRRAGQSWAQEAYVKASNTTTDANLTSGFGIAVAVSGDTLAVGSYIEPSKATGVNGDQSDKSALNAGAVYVFSRSSSTWSQQAYVKPSNTRALALFGYSVALSGNTLVVGSIGESSNARGVDGDQTNTSMPSAGAAYVFVRSGVTWQQQTYLKATNARADAVFGYAVAQSNGTFAVGSIFESSAAKGIDGDGSDTSAPTAGAVYVFPGP